MSIPIKSDKSKIVGTIYEQLKEAGVPVEQHGPGLLAMVTRESRAIIEKNGLKAVVFYNKVDHQSWFVISSAYSPGRGK